MEAVRAVEVMLEEAAAWPGLLPNLAPLLWMDQASACSTGYWPEVSSEQVQVVLGGGDRPHTTKFGAC